MIELQKRSFKIYYWIILNKSIAMIDPIFRNMMKSINQDFSHLLGKWEFGKKRGYKRRRRKNVYNFLKRLIISKKKPVTIMKNNAFLYQTIIKVILYIYNIYTLYI